MVVETINESLCVNKLVATKKEILMVEGDMIVPDAKPDILNTICTSGVVCIYKKEVSDEKLRLDGSINTYIMYLTEDGHDKKRGLCTNLDFSETITVPNIKDNMIAQLETNLKTIECKVINGRKIGIKATLEVEINVYSKEEVEIIKDIPNAEEIQMLKENLKVNSLIGSGETKISARETIAIPNTDNLVEILKSNICLCDKDIKISYNKVLAKAEALIKLMYLTEDDRVNCISTKVPIVGFIDIQNVTEENICDINYEIRNILIKPNQIEEHSISIEMEVHINVMVYEEREIYLIQDLYSPCENLEFHKKRITTMMEKKNRQEMKQVKENIMIEGLSDKEIVDIDVIPNIEKETKSNNRIVYEGELTLNLILVSQDLQMETRSAKIPFDYAIDGLENGENMNSKMTIEVANQDFMIQDNGNINSNIDLKMNHNSYRDSNMNIMNEIQTSGEREAQDYSIILYIVKKGDSLWKIAKRFGSTIEDIARVNGIEDENKIYPGQKLFIPRYIKKERSTKDSSMIQYA